MTPILENIPWMTWNVVLALLGLLFAQLFSRATKLSEKLWWALLWVLFLPNTLYLLTDLKHLAEQWSRVGEAGKFILLAQFGILTAIGIATYIAGIQEFEKGLIAWVKRSSRSGAKLSQMIIKFPNRFIVGFNFLVSFGVVMGRAMRTNSWHVFTQPLRVIQDGLAVMTSAEMLVATIVFGVVVNGIWWLSKLSTAKSIK